MVTWPRDGHAYPCTIAAAPSCQNAWISAAHRAERAKASIVCETPVNARQPAGVLGFRKRSGNFQARRTGCNIRGGLHDRRAISIVPDNSIRNPAGAAEGGGGGRCAGGRTYDLPMVKHPDPKQQTVIARTCKSRERSSGTRSFFFFSFLRRGGREKNDAG